MALFGGQRDISFFLGVNRELVNNVVEQQIDYYKPYLQEFKSKDTDNLYGEASANKTYHVPVRLNCLIDYQPDTPLQDDQIGINMSRIVNFAFIRERLEDLNLVADIGDIIEYRNKYFEVDDVNEGQFILGKDKDYPKSVGKEWGRSMSTVVVAHQTSTSRLQITKTNRF